MNKLYRFDLQWNDSYAFRAYPRLTESERMHQGLVPNSSGAADGGLNRCDYCAELASKWDLPLSDLVPKKRSYDLSLTYDGIMVASERFKQAYDDGDLTGLTFRQLPKAISFFGVRAVRAVEFDPAKSQSEFIDKCPISGCYETVTGALPTNLKAGAQIGDNELVRTDLEFASGDMKHPLLLCGEAVAKCLKQAKLKGVVTVRDVCIGWGGETGT